MKLNKCIQTYIFYDENIKENSSEEIVKSLNRIFSNKKYLKNLENSKARWIDNDIKEITKYIVDVFN